MTLTAPPAATAAPLADRSPDAVAPRPAPTRSAPRPAPRPLARGDALAAARDLVPRFAARAEAADRAGECCAADLADLRDAGLLGLLVPTRLGGSGAGFADYAAVASVLATGSGATALVYNMHASVTGALALTPDEVARELGAPESFFAMRDRFLAAAAGGAFYAVAMSERGAGSRLSAMTTTYTPADHSRADHSPADHSRADRAGTGDRPAGDGAGWHITGAKAFCSGAGLADAYLLAAHPPGDPLTVSQFVVAADTPGITVDATWDSLGMRATGSQDVTFDVTVPADALLGGMEGLGLLLAQAMPQWLVASYAAVYAGVARSAVDAAVAHLGERGLAGLPAVRARVGRADAAVAAAEQVVAAAAAAVDDDPGSAETNRWVFRAKLLAGETAATVAASLLEAAGTSATRRGSVLERLYRDARCGSLQPATSDVCADWLGTDALGSDPDAPADGPARW